MERHVIALTQCGEVSDGVFAEWLVLAEGHFRDRCHDADQLNFIFTAEVDEPFEVFQMLLLDIFAVPGHGGVRFRRIFLKALDRDESVLLHQLDGAPERLDAVIFVGVRRFHFAQRIDPAEIVPVQIPLEGNRAEVGFQYFVLEIPEFQL